MGQLLKTLNLIFFNAEKLYRKLQLMYEEYMSNFLHIRFDNSFARQLPGDLSKNPLPRLTPEVCYSLTLPTPVKNPQIIAWSSDIAQLLDIKDPTQNDAIEAQIFSGNQIIEGMQPLAARYGGHQFGHWAGQLGDGRAISLGEVVNSQLMRWEIQLKGAGPTPYSRSADGRAVLRSSLREFLCSEAMFHLGIPTTRALACMTTGEEVIRDMFYDGNPAPEPGAIVTRVAPSFLRFGNFEILAASGEHELLKKLVDYTIHTHFSHLAPPSESTYVEWFKEICERTAHLMIHWLRVGFVHGVMNTDNLSILGLTIDYGPYGFLDNYDPDWTPNTTDAERRRYRYSQQPNIAIWNLTRLAEALGPLLGSAEKFRPGLDHFAETFNQHYPQMLAAKLGLSSLDGEDDFKLVEKLDALLRLHEADMTLFYRRLADWHLVPENNSLSSENLADFFASVFYEYKKDSPLLAEWFHLYSARVKKENKSPAEIARSMNLVNPYFILRNYIAQEVIEDLSKLEQVMQAMKNPYEENGFTREYFKLRPEWAKTKAGCSALSCSS